MATSKTNKTFSNLALFWDFLKVKNCCKTGSKINLIGIQRYFSRRTEFLCGYIDSNKCNSIQKF